MRKLKLFLACLLMAVLSIGQMWGADSNTPTSGSQYRLKAVKTGTGAGTYYMVAPTTSGLGGTTTTESDGTVFTFTQESSKWYVTFTKNSTTYYMYEHKDNGKVNISTTKTEVAIGTNGDYVKIGSSKWIQFNYNSGSPRMGAYSSNQVGVVLSSVSSPQTDACATPTFSPAAGTYASAQNVTISCATQDATIYYTTDGSEPTTSSSTYTSAIPVSANTTIKAFAVKSGLENSSVASATYTIVSIEHAGTESDPYTVADARNAIAVGGDLSNKHVAGIISQVDSYNSTYSSITYWISDDGETTSPQLEVYSGKGLNGAGFSAVTDLQVADEVTVKGTLKLYGEIYEFDKNNQLVTFNRPGSATPCATPTFSPVAGTYTEVQTVSISCETEGATIYYTTDGTNPTNESSVYSSAISVGENMTIKAIAMKEGMENSFVATAAYTINLPEDEEVQKTWDLSIDETETASEDKLTWTATYVDMSFAKGTSTTNANNYYPGTSGQSYTSTRTYKNSVITITPNGKEITSIVFTATTQGYGTALKNSSWSNASATSEAAVVTVTPENGTQAISATIGATCGFTAVCVHYKNPDATKPADPTFSPVAGTYTEVQTVSISCETEGATIYYTTDGTNPTNESSVYSSAISVGENMTIKAIAIKDDKSSNVASAAYEINLPVSEEDQKTWDLTKDEMASASADELTWTATYVDMSITRGTSTDANNYCPPDHEETRVYTGATLTISPKGKQITTIVFETNGSTPFKNATWTNGAFSNDGNTVTITASAPGNVEAVFGANTRIYSVQVNYGPIDTSIPEAPTFSPAAGTYTSAQSVELACATEGATIYYTTDGTTPTSESTEYTAAISVGENMTIKAIAINNDKVSSVATANYVINLPLSTMDQIFAAATAVGSTATDANIQFNNWVVSGVSTNGKNVFVTDGTKGFIIFDNGGEMGFAVGDVLSGTVACKVQLYKGAAELTNLSSATEGLNIAKEGVITPVVKAINALSGINTGAAVTINSVQFDGTNLSDGVNSIKPFNSLFAYDALENDTYYNVTGIYQQFDNTKEILPRSAADIDEVNLEDPELSYSPASVSLEVGQALSAPTFNNPHELAVTYSVSGDAVATVTNEGVIALVENATGTAVITASFAGNAQYAVGNATFTITVNPASVSENVVIIAEYDSKFYALTNSISNKTAAAVEVEKDGDKIVVPSNEAKVAIQWTKRTSGVNTTFQDANDKYLKGVSNGGDLTVVDAVCNWSWNATDEYYYIGSRSFIYRESANGFKNYAVSNAGSSDYSTIAEVRVIDPANIVVTSKVDPELAFDPEEVTLTVGDAFVAPVLGYVEGFDGLAAVTYESSNENVATVNESGVVSLVADATGTATITATFAGNSNYLAGSASYVITVNEAGDDLTGTWVLASSVAAGDKIIIANVAVAGELLTMGAQNGSYREQVASTVDGENKLTPAAGTKVFTLVDASTINPNYEGFALQASNGNYLSSASNSSNNIKEVASVSDANAVWSIVISEGVAAIVAQGSYARKVIRYNSGNTRFSCYAESNTMADVVIYKHGAAPEPVDPDYTEVRNGLTEGWYYTMCLDKAVTAVKAGSIWRVLSKAANGSDVILEEAELPLDAGRPYIFRAAASTLEVAYTGDAVGAPVNDEDNNGLVGSFTEEPLAQNPNHYIIYNNALYYVNSDNVKVGAHRAYLNMTGVPAYSNEPQQGAPRRRVTMAVYGEQTATGIDALNATEAPVKMMINGQMYILRGEKMYDATGRLVK